MFSLHRKRGEKIKENEARERRAHYTRKDLPRSAFFWESGYQSDSFIYILTHLFLLSTEKVKKIK